MAKSKHNSCRRHHEEIKDGEMEKIVQIRSLSSKKRSSSSQYKFEKCLSNSSVVSSASKDTHQKINYQTLVCREEPTLAGEVKLDNIQKKYEQDMDDDHYRRVFRDRILKELHKAGIKQDNDRRCKTIHVSSTDKLTSLIDSSRLSGIVTENVLLQIIKDDLSMEFINDLSIDKPICTMIDKTVTTTHIDDVCGLGEVETTNKWTVSLMPNRQLRLEDGCKSCCIRLAKNPVFHEGNVTVEGYLVPGGHLFRLTFANDISNKEKQEWLTVCDNRYICNESILDYMIRHPHGALESIRSDLRIQFVYDPDEVDTSLKMKIEKYECYYYKRHFYYKAIDRKFVGHLKIGKWGARDDLEALFFIGEGAPEHGSDYLMAVASDVVWFRAWKATIYSDFQTSKATKINNIRNNRITPLKTDYLAVRQLILFKKVSEQFRVGKFVFDYATREFSCVNLAKKKAYFEAHRIVEKIGSEKKNYDFVITGLDLRTKNVVDLQVHVAIPENLQQWEDALAIPLSRAFAFLELTLEEMNKKGCTLCEGSYKERSPYTFDELTQLIAVLPKVQVLSIILSTLQPYMLEKLVLLTFEALYRPLISLKEAETLIVNEHKKIGDILGPDRTRILQLVHRHVHRVNDLNSLRHQKETSKRTNWRLIVPYLMRTGEMRVKNCKELVDDVVMFLDHAPYGCPV